MRKFWKVSKRFLIRYNTNVIDSRVSMIGHAFLTTESVIIPRRNVQKWIHRFSSLVWPSSWIVLRGLAFYRRERTVWRHDKIKCSVAWPGSAHCVRQLIGLKTWGRLEMHRGAYWLRHARKIGTRPNFASVLTVRFSVNVRPSD